MPWCKEWCVESETLIVVCVEALGEDPTSVTMGALCNYFSQLRHLPKTFEFHLDLRKANPLALLPYLPLILRSIRCQQHMLNQESRKVVCRQAYVYLKASLSAHICALVVALFHEITSVCIVVE